MADKFCVDVARLYSDDWPAYFENFWNDCNRVADENDWRAITVANYQLKPHGKLIQTKTQGWYLRWDDEKYHTHFVLRWS
jgi:hypothetical protein